MNCPYLPIAITADCCPETLAIAFANALEMPFQQGWTATPEFRPATAHIGWHGNKMYYLVEMEDDEIFTTGRNRNDFLWQLGDVLELFAGVAGESPYIEYHCAPNGVILQFLWPDYASCDAAKTPEDLANYFVADEKSWSRVLPRTGGWAVVGALDASALGLATPSLADQSWDVSFSRYDAYSPTTAREPLLSATAPLPRIFFHDRTHWQKIGFRN